MSEDSYCTKIVLHNNYYDSGQLSKTFLLLFVRIYW